jgi:hypothetical protein
MTRIHFLCLMAAAISFTVACQGQASGPKQGGATKKEEVVINGKKITIEHRQPSADGKQKFGQVVGYGKVWDAGAISLTSEAALSFGTGECKVPPGSYTLFPVPEGIGKWTLIVGKRAARYDQASELCRAAWTPESSGEKKDRPVYAVYLIRVNSQPFDVGMSVLRLVWLDDGVEGFMLVQ